MPTTRPRYTKEEFARRDAVYERDIRPLVEERGEGKFVAIDIDTGSYEVDVDEQAASDRLLARVPDAQVWLKRIGSRYVRRVLGMSSPQSRLTSMTPTGSWSGSTLCILADGGMLRPRVS